MTPPTPRLTTPELVKALRQLHDQLQGSPINATLADGRTVVRIITPGERAILADAARRLEYAEEVKSGQHTR